MVQTAAERDEQFSRWVRRAQRFRSARLLRWAGGLIAFGLLVEMISLFWSHPLSFLIFIGLGLAPVVLGIVAYLVLLGRLPIATPEA